MGRKPSRRRAGDRGPPRIVLLLESSRGSGRAMLRGIAHYAHLHGPWSFFWEPAGLEKAWPVIQAREADGIILRDVGRVDAVVASGIPAVVVGHQREEVPGVINVITDSQAVGRLAARHLMDCGFHHFGYCGVAKSRIEQTPWSQERGDSFGAALAEQGFLLHHFIPAGQPRPGSWRQDRQRLARWLKALPRPAGVLACNDDRGREVIEASRLAGLAVPDEIAVLGVDDDALVAGLSNPPMSSVAVHFEKAGYECAQALDRLLHGQGARATRVRVRASHVVARHSTDILAVADEAVGRALRFIRQRGRENPPVTDVAQAAGLCRRTLEKRFRQTLGRSVLAEIRRVRVERIARLLADTDQPIAAVAERFGFAGPQHFARYFRGEKGMTPREFRRLCRPQ